MRASSSCLTKLYGINYQPSQRAASIYPPETLYPIMRLAQSYVLIFPCGDEADYNNQTPQLFLCRWQ